MHIGLTGCGLSSLIADSRTVGFVCALLAVLVIALVSAWGPDAAERRPAFGRAMLPPLPPAPRNRVDDPVAPPSRPAAGSPGARPQGPDLIARMSWSLELPRVRDPAVEREMRRYLADEHGLNRILQRAEPYLHYIVQTIEGYGMPLDLALLPIVESSYNPYAYSHKHAAGLWQIVPGTGRDLGLTQDSVYDARFDIIASTEAALAYLRQLNDRFEGDWLLSLAGYNAGGGAVERALQRAGATRVRGSFPRIRAWLPEETRTHVARMLALSRIFAAPDRHGLALHAIPDRPRFRAVRTGGQADLLALARAFGIHADRLRLLNPAHNGRATAPHAPLRVLMPIEVADRIPDSLASGRVDARAATNGAFPDPVSRR